MATTAGLIIKTHNGGDETVQKTISNVNPNASFGALDSFARKFVALSRDNYIDSCKVTKELVSEGLAKEQEGAD